MTIEWTQLGYKTQLGQHLNWWALIEWTSWQEMSGYRLFYQCYSCQHTPYTATMTELYAREMVSKGQANVYKWNDEKFKSRNVYLSSLDVEEIKNIANDLCEEYFSQRSYFKGFSLEELDMIYESLELTLTQIHILPNRFLKTNEIDNVQQLCKKVDAEIRHRTLIQQHMKQI